MTNQNEQPLIFRQEVREQKQNESGFESSLKKLKNQEWYKKLSPEQQENVEQKYQERLSLQKKLEQKKAEIWFKWISADIIFKWIQKNLPKIEDSEDKKEIQWFEERVDMLNRDIDFLKRELYATNLQLSQVKLENSFESKSRDFLSKFENKELPDVITNWDLNTIRAWEIYALRENWYDLSELFLDWTWEVSKENMKIWDVFTVNFWKNWELNSLIWAWDLLPINEIDKVKINWVLWTRKSEPRPWYYASNGKYLAIFNNYKIEIVSKKTYSKPEEEKYNKSFENRYVNIRTREVMPDVLSEFSENNSHKLDLANISAADFTLVSNYLEKYIPEGSLTFDKSNKTISTNGKITLKEIFSEYLDFWVWYIRYKKIAKEVSSKYPKISEKDLVNLINHENPGWNPLLGVAWWSAYWLWQMIDKTWERFNKDSSWNFRDRNNPVDQLEATCDYLVFLMKNKNCPIELAMAYYNTGENIMWVSESKAKEYYFKNPQIAKKIPQGTKIDAKSYFTWAVAYYNDISYEQASLIAYKELH